MVKRNPESSSRGDQGEMLVGLVVSKMGHLWHPNARREVAIDGDIELFSETHESTSRFLSVQVKTRTGAGGRHPIRLKCDINDIAYWREADRPVLVVLMDLDLDQAWFVCAQEYFSRTLKPTSTIYFNPDVDRFDTSISPYLFELSGAWLQHLRSNVNEAASSIVTSRQVLQQFHTALTQAIADCRREKKVGPTPLFLDSYIAVSGVLPFQTAVTQSMNRLKDDRIYSTMLWRLGYLGQGMLLTPHAAEFYDAIRHYSIAHRDAMVPLLRHDLTIRALAELRVAIQDPDAPVSALMAQLRRISRETAVLVAALLLESQPLHSISDVVGIHDEFFSIDDLMRSPLFKEMRGLIEQHARRLVNMKNVLRDAAALTVLAERVKKYQRGEIASVGYFATQTASVISLLRDERLRSFFSPEDSTNSLGDSGESPESILRTSEYLICRSTFRCLRRREGLTFLSKEACDAERLTFNAIETCVAELTNVLDDLATHDPDEWFRLERLPIGGVTLVAVVEYLRSLASMDAVWLADRALGIRRLCQITRYSDVEEFVINNYSEMIAWAQKEFADRVDSLAKWRSTYKRLVKQQRSD